MSILQNTDIWYHNSIFLSNYLHLSFFFRIFALVFKFNDIMAAKQKYFSRRIGEVFTFFRGNAAAPLPINLVVKEVAEPKCIGCYFYNPHKKDANNPYGCTKIYNYAGDCDEQMRKDKKNVIFVENEK